MDAAVRLLLEKGYEGTTMQDIAEESEFAVGTIYRFFKGKKELFEELILSIWHEVEKRLGASLRESDHELECLRAYNRESAVITLEYKNLAQIYYGHMLRYNWDMLAGLDGEVRNIMSGFIDRLEELFRSGIQKGIFVDLDPRILALGYDTIVGSYMTIAYGKEESVDLDAWVQTIDRMFFDRVLLS
ncbi:MAG: helix-turn-helix transcriptional regulator [Candidatus Omnitrophica bacterium]|nr:helix-turn-helix transcriptional regulator [Candidatus Omnitrophota bacterium]